MARPCTRRTWPSTRSGLANRGAGRSSGGGESRIAQRARRMIAGPECQPKSRTGSVDAVPGVGRFADLAEHPLVEVVDLHELGGERTLVPVEEPGAAHVALVADGPAGRVGRRDDSVVVLGPPGVVLEALTPGVEELAVHRRLVVVGHDQLQLEITGVGQRDRDRGLRRLAPMGESVELEVPEADPGSDVHPRGEPVRGGVEVVHDVAVLADGSGKDRHGALLTARRW